MRAVIVSRRGRNGAVCWRVEHRREAAAQPVAGGLEAEQLSRRRAGVEDATSLLVRRG